MTSYLSATLTVQAYKLYHLVHRENHVVFAINTQKIMIPWAHDATFENRCHQFSFNWHQATMHRNYISYYGYILQIARTQEICTSGQLAAQFVFSGVLVCSFNLVQKIHTRLTPCSISQSQIPHFEVPAWVRFCILIGQSQACVIRLFVVQRKISMVYTRVYERPIIRDDQGTR